MVNKKLVKWHFLKKKFFQLFANILPINFNKDDNSFGARLIIALQLNR